MPRSCNNPPVSSGQPSRGSLAHVCKLNCLFDHPVRYWPAPMMRSVCVLLALACAAHAARLNDFSAIRAPAVGEWVKPWYCHGEAHSSAGPRRGLLGRLQAAACVCRSLRGDAAPARRGAPAMGFWFSCHSPHACAACPRFRGARAPPAAPPPCRPGLPALHIREECVPGSRHTDGGAALLQARWGKGRAGGRHTGHACIAAMMVAQGCAHHLLVWPCRLANSPPHLPGAQPLLLLWAPAPARCCCCCCCTVHGAHPAAHPAALPGRAPPGAAATPASPLPAAPPPRSQVGQHGGGVGQVRQGGGHRLLPPVQVHQRGEAGAAASSLAALAAGLPPLGLGTGGGGHCTAAACAGTRAASPAPPPLSGTSAGSIGARSLCRQVPPLGCRCMSLCGACGPICGSCRPPAACCCLPTLPALVTGCCMPPPHPAGERR